VLKTSNELVFGRNLDWVSDNGLLIVNKRNVVKKSLVFTPDKAIEWTSKYGSITFNQFGKEFPFGGINEKGLVVEIMVADAEYPVYDERPAVNELQWIQYQLDNARTIDEVINSDKIIRISEIDQKLHFLICDSYGDVAVIEFMNNKMIVFKGKDLPFPILENDTYSKSLIKYKNKTNCRFETATTMIKNYQPSIHNSIINYSFDILDSVKLSGSWSIVYDIKNMKIHFKTQSNKKVQIIDCNFFNFSCEQECMMYDLQMKQEGNIDKQFIPFDSKKNKKKMQYAIKSNDLNFSKDIIFQFYSYHKNCICLR